MATDITRCIGRSAGQYNKKLSIIGDITHKVVLHKIDGTHNERFMGNIFIPETGEMNHRMSKYRVIDCSIACTDDYGLVEGDIVLADRLACYYDTDPIQVMDYENIICKYDDDGEPQPLNDMIFVKEMKRIDIKSRGVILLTDDDIPLGRVCKSSSDIFKTDSIVLMTTGADVITVDGVLYSIYKSEMILGVITMDDTELGEYK